MQNNSILTKGRAICLVLDSARHLLAELSLDNEVFEATQKDCESERIIGKTLCL